MQNQGNSSLEKEAFLSSLGRLATKLLASKAGRAISSKASGLARRASSSARNLRKTRFSGAASGMSSSPIMLPAPQRKMLPAPKKSLPIVSNGNLPKPVGQSIVARAAGRANTKLPVKADTTLVTSGPKVSTPALGTVETPRIETAARTGTTTSSGVASIETPRAKATGGTGAGASSGAANTGGSSGGSTKQTSGQKKTKDLKDTLNSYKERFNNMVKDIDNGYKSTSLYRNYGYKPALGAGAALSFMAGRASVGSRNTNDGSQQ